MENEAWENFKQYYTDTFGATVYIAELIASEDILRLCVFGFSNSHISRSLEIDEEYVIESINHYFDFEGFEDDLDINPYSIFKNTSSFYDFEQEIFVFSPLVLDNIVKLCYNNCVRYTKIREELDKFYDAS